MTIEEQIKQMVDEYLEDKFSQLVLEDINHIRDAILPDIDALIARHIKMHFGELGKYIAEHYSDGRN